MRFLHFMFFHPHLGPPPSRGRRIRHSHREEYCSLNRPLWGRHPFGSAHGPKPPAMPGDALLIKNLESLIVVQLSVV